MQSASRGQAKSRVGELACNSPTPKKSIAKRTMIALTAAQNPIQTNVVRSRAATKPLDAMTA